MIASLRLLAEDPIYIQMGRNFRGNSGDRTSEVLIFSLALVTIIGLMWIIHRTMELRQERQKTSPDALFSVLCKAHRLKRKDRRSLRAFAISQSLPHPAMVFVSPERLADQELAGLDDRKRNRLISIRDRVFGSETAA